jgi:large subunit ribosomal protein L21
MYAVIKTGGKQYRVKQGDVFNVERLALEVGSEMTFSEVMAVGEGASLAIGTPYVGGASVSATVIAQARAKKIIVFKFKRRKNYQRKRGHRQYFTRIRINSITA